MTIENNRQAMRAMKIAFKLANKSINFSRPRRLQCLATAKKLIKAAEDFTQAQPPVMEEKKYPRRTIKPPSKRINKKFVP